MRNDKFGLLAGLFTSPIIEKEENNIKNENTKENTTKRTWKIKDSLWEDFVTLSNALGITQAEIINLLIESAIEQNRAKIKSYNAIIKK